MGATWSLGGPWVGRNPPREKDLRLAVSPAAVELPGIRAKIRTDIVTLLADESWWSSNTQTGDKGNLV